MNKNYQYIKNGFPELKSNNRFANEYDYENLADVNCHIKICRVPFDTGEAHVEHRLIFGYGHVVGWESQEQRDKYLDSLDGYSFDSNYRSFHRDTQYSSHSAVSIPIPFYAITDLNYIIIDYEKWPTEYGEADGITRFCYFIRDMEMVAPNNTRCTVAIDAWTTYIPYIQMKQVLIERGHLPLAKSPLNKYFENPLENRRYITAPEEIKIKKIEANYISAQKDVIINDENTLAIFIYSCNPWISSDANVLSGGTRAYTVNNIPSGVLVAIYISDYEAFVSNMANVHRQCIDGVIFVPENLISYNHVPNVLYGVNAYQVYGSNQNSINIFEFNKELFNYPKEYEHLTKLYTSPYAHLEISDYEGNVTKVNIEDTTGKLYLNGNLSLVVNECIYNAHVAGIGANDDQVQFMNISNKNVYIGGRFYEANFNWSWPTFCLIQSPYDQNILDTQSERDTLANNAQNSYNIANADINYNTRILNASNSAIIRKNSIFADTNSLLIDIENQKALHDTSLASKYTTKMTDISVAKTFNETNAQIQASLSSTAINMLGGAVAGTVTGGIAGGLSSSLSAAGSGMVSASLAAANFTYTSTADTEAEVVAVLYNNQAYDGTIKQFYPDLENEMGVKQYNLETGELIIEQNYQNTIVEKDFNTDTTNYLNDRISTVRDYNYNTEMQNIEYIKQQGNLMKPIKYGEVSNAGMGSIMPIGIHVNVVRVSDEDIHSAGDKFLRFGYNLNQWEDFTTWNIMPKFTFWKLGDFLMEITGIPDFIMDKLRLMLMGGITVWRNPDDIGNTSIYENV